MWHLQLRDVHAGPRAPDLHVECLARACSPRGCPSKRLGCPWAQLGDQRLVSPLSLRLRVSE